MASLSPNRVFTNTPQNSSDVVHRVAVISMFTAEWTLYAHYYHYHFQCSFNSRSFSVLL